MQLAVAWRLARRELRGSLRGLSVFLACLALGVGAIAAVGVVSAGIIAGVERDAAALLGGDFRIDNTNAPLAEDELAVLVPPGARVARSVRTTAMGYGNGRRTAAELRAVDAAYPLYGEVRLDPPLPLEDALAGGGAVVERGLLARLGLELGDRVRVGDAELVIRAVVEREPDRVGDFISIGPRVLIGLDQLDRTGAILPGALARYTYAVALPEGMEPAPIVRGLKRAYPEATWRVRAIGDVQPSVARFTQRLASYLTIAGLSALLIGGLGVALAVQNYLGARTTTIATLKCLGAPGGLVFRIYLLQVLALTSVGVLIGLVLGQAAPLALGLLPEGLLPVPVLRGVYPAPLLIAAGCGYLAALVFTLWPLQRARAVSAAAVFRSLVSASRARLRWRDGAALGVCLAALAGLALLSVGDRMLGAAFIGVAAGAALVLAGLAFALLRAAGRVGGQARGPLRLALANLRRPGSGSAGVVTALGAGLAVLTMVAVLQQNLTAELEERLPERAPSFFFIDIQPDQMAPFQRIVQETAGAALLDRSPLVRGRVVRIDGHPVDQVKIDPEVQWTVRRDRGLTFRGEPPEDLELVEGAWWSADYTGPPLVSVDAETARGYGVGPGDTIAFNILGRIVEAEIASLRDVAWEDGGMNWVFILSPGVLEAAPHTWIATVASEEASDAGLVEAVTEELPNVTPISVRAIVAQVAGVLARIGVAVKAVSGVTLASGLLVLAGAIAAARRRHLYEAVVLKVLGATRLDLLRTFLLEYLALGLAAGLAGAALGTFGAWVVVLWVLELPWVFAPLGVLRVVLIGLVLTLGAGFLGTWRLLGRPAAPVLRTP